MAGSGINSLVSHMSESSLATWVPLISTLPFLHGSDKTQGLKNEDKKKLMRNIFSKAKEKKCMEHIHPACTWTLRKALNTND